MGKRADNTKSVASSLKLNAAAMHGDVVRELDLDLIDDNPHQPRTSMDEVALADLTKSIKSEGVTQPIVVRKYKNSEGQERYQSAFGHRRRVASKAAGLKTIDAIVRDYDDDTMLLIALTENVQRENMSIVDEINAAAKLVGLIGQAAAVSRLGKPKSWLSKATAIHKAPEFVQEFIAKGFSSDMEGLYGLAGLAKKNPDAAQDLIDAWINNPEVRSDLRGQIKEINAPVKTLKDHVEPSQKLKDEQQQTIDYEPDNNSEQGFGKDGLDTKEPSETKTEKPLAEHRAKPEKVKEVPPLLSDAVYENGSLQLITNDGVKVFDVTDEALGRLVNAIKG